MTTNNGIPSESRQQVINKLKSTKHNIILTSSIFGLSESYLKEYSKQDNTNKIITLTEMHEIHSQIIPQFSSYLETTIALDLCKQLKERGIEIPQLDKMIHYIKHSQNLAIIGNKPVGQKRYQTSTIMEKILNMVPKNYQWEWVILNYDNPIANAEMIQQKMFAYMEMKNQFSRILFSAYDERLKNCENWNQQFQIITLPDTIPYEEVQKEALMILNYLYPMLQKKEAMIRRILENVELQHIYEQNHISASIFMEGIQRFYEAYSCICSTGYLLSDIEAISRIREYINTVSAEKKHEKVKKPKLYI